MKMSRYLVQPRGQKFVKGYRFLSFAKIMSKNNSKNKSKNLSRKYHQKLLDHAKQSIMYTLKTDSKRAIQNSGSNCCFHWY